MYFTYQTQILHGTKQSGRGSKKDREQNLIDEPKSYFILYYLIEKGMYQDELVADIRIADFFGVHMYILHLNFEVIFFTFF